MPPFIAKDLDDEYARPEFTRWRNDMAECLRCRGKMTEGFAISQSDGGQLGWVDGEPSFWATLTAGFRTKITSLSSRRCTECGFVEFLTDERAKPVKTLKSVDEENERLRKLVMTLKQRLETLEAIATDPGQRTSREIEALRALPSTTEETRS
jgi:hypothetical protein